MKTFCILKRETHPDRCIDEVIGPFNADDDEAAKKLADEEIKRQLANDVQWYKDFTPYAYDIWEMVKPEA